MAANTVPRQVAMGFKPRIDGSAWDSHAPPSRSTRVTSASPVTTWATSMRTSQLSHGVSAVQSSSVTSARRSPKNAHAAV